MKLKDTTLKFIDLFAGIGGIRKGFELACADRNIQTECVFTSEIKAHAIQILKQNHPEENVYGDITRIPANAIPPFDFLLAGFPCQAFSAAGKRLGFADTRGTMFFEVERILKEHLPYGFILENVDGLVYHDKIHPNDPIGKTFSIILERLASLGYKVSWRVLNAKEFGVPQDRKRIYIVGTREEIPDLQTFPKHTAKLEDILEHGLPISDSPFVQNILLHYSIEDLIGKSIKDKRGGKNNIHSWDIAYKGEVSQAQKDLLNRMMTERRKKKWAEIYGIQWMDGMPLTINMIREFYDVPNLEILLEDLVQKHYLKLEHPKRREGNARLQDSSLPLGYNIVAGKMSYEVGKILNPKDIAPTLVAMDMQHLYVADGNGIRPLSLREGLRLFGYPDSFKFSIGLQEGRDLLGNTVVVPVIREVSKRVLDIYIGGKHHAT